MLVCVKWYHRQNGVTWLQNGSGLETLAQLAEGCWCSNHVHAHTQTRMYTHTQTHWHTCSRTHAHTHLQVGVLLCAAKALCGLLQGWFFGRGGVWKSRLLLVGRVWFSVWHSLSDLAVNWEWESWFCRSGWIIRGKRVRIGNVLNGFRFLHAFLLAFLLFLAFLQGGLRCLHQDGWILLQILASWWLSQHNNSRSVHPRGGFEVQLSSVLFPALQLGMMLPFQISGCHWNLQDLWQKHTVESKKKTVHSFSVQQFWRMWPLRSIKCRVSENTVLQIKGGIVGWTWLARKHKVSRQISLSLLL